MMLANLLRKSAELRTPWALVVVCGLWGAACSGDDARSSLPPAGLEQDRSTDLVEFVPCERGVTRACYRMLGEHGGVVSCFAGSETCQADGKWGPCVQGTVTTIEAAEKDALGKSLLALSSTAECEDNPCNPSCRVFDEDPDEVGEEFTIELTSNFDWETGRLSQLPKGLVDKGLNEPCSTGSDCQFNTQCRIPSSGKCAHDKCSVGDALNLECDPCVSMVCERAPWCCGEAAPLEPGEDEPGSGAVCCEGQVEYDGRCYVLVEQDYTWGNARENCQGIGDAWDLVSIADGNENEFVASQVTSSDTWIGITEANGIGSNGRWRWSSGVPAGDWHERSGNGLYTNFSSGEPDDGETCARMRDDAQWYGRDCGVPYDSMCEGPPACEPAEAAPPSSSPGCCAGETPYDGRCYRFVDDGREWSDARDVCQGFGAGWDLASIADGGENALVASLAGGDDAWIGLTEGNGIGSNGLWRWSSGDPAGAWIEFFGFGMYANFGWGEPDSGEDCARIHSNEQWSGRGCNYDHPFVCEGPPSCEGAGQGQPAPACTHDPCRTGEALASNCDACVVAVCAADPSCCTTAWTAACVALVATECEAQCTCASDESYYDGHCYYLETDNAKWTDARSWCQGRGSGWELASIGDENENAFVDGLATGPDTWIGLTEGNGVGSNNQWRWSNGDPSGTWIESTRSGMYHKFVWGEPNNGEACARMRGDGSWYGISCSQQYDSVCESASAASLSFVSPVFIPAPPSEDEPDDDEETDGDGDDDEDGPPPYDGPREWTEECVDLAQSVCDVACSSNDEDATAAVCVPWYPGETEASCAGIDLAVGVPCEQSIPVCNHGNTEAPAGIRLVHFPANSQQYPSCEPNLNHPNMAECFTQEPIAPGKCINVTGCPSLTGNREIMVNPVGTTQVEECSCLDNWSLFRAGTDCGPPVCSGGTNSASVVERPVDIIVSIDNSASMQGEIVAVQQRINDDLAQIIQNSGVDYRLIMVSRYGNVHQVNYGGGNAYDSAYSVCVGAPLTSLDCPTSSYDSTPNLSHSPTFYHHSTDIGSRDMFCKLTQSLAQSDPINSRFGWTPVAPNGWGAYLREDALKVFVGITDDAPGTNSNGSSGLCRNSTGFGDSEAGARAFDVALRTAAPGQFGAYDPSNPDAGRNYVWHSIIGMAGNSTSQPTALQPSAAIESKCCKGDGSKVNCPNDSAGTHANDAPRNGLAYQHLSKITGGLRYPICYNDNFNDIFNEIAKVVIDGARVSCSFELQNAGSFDIDAATVTFRETNTSNPIEFDRVDSAASCSANHWYQPNPDDPARIELCPNACALVQGAPDGQLSLEVGCLGTGYEPYTFEQVYAAACRFDEAVQWGYFGVQVTTPGDSSVVIRARTAPSEAELSTASFVELVTLSQANGNTDCQSPDVPGCPIDLYDELGGAPNAHYDYIEIQTTVHPTSDGSQMPRIDDWNLNFACPDVN